MAEKAKAIKLTPGQKRALINMAWTAANPREHTKVGGNNNNRGYITDRTCDKLEQLGLITKVPNPGYRSGVKLTTKGLEVAERTLLSSKKEEDRALATDFLDKAYVKRVQVAWTDTTRPGYAVCNSKDGGTVRRLHVPEDATGAQLVAATKKVYAERGWETVVVENVMLKAELDAAVSQSQKDLVFATNHVAQAEALLEMLSVITDESRGRDLLTGARARIAQGLEIYEEMRAVQNNHWGLQHNNTMSYIVSCTRRSLGSVEHKIKVAETRLDDPASAAAHRAAVAFHIAPEVKPGLNGSKDTKVTLSAEDFQKLVDAACEE